MQLFDPRVDLTLTLGFTTSFRSFFSQLDLMNSVKIPIQLSALRPRMPAARARGGGNGCETQTGSTVAGPESLHRHLITLIVK